MGAKQRQGKRERHRKQRQGRGICRHLRAEPLVVPRPRERRQHGEPDRGSRQNDDDENTPYDAKKPSVSAVRPKSRAMMTPTTAARPVCTASATAVTAPLPSEPSPDETVRLATIRGSYAP